LSRIRNAPSQGVWKSPVTENLLPLTNAVAESTSSQDPARGAAVAWLMGRINYERTAALPYQERQLKLDRMRQLLTRLGQPDAGMRIIHVAGTKGKGSTSVMIAAMLSAAGYRAGLFSSPHLERIEERFAVDGEPCTASELVALVDRLRPVVQVMDDEAVSESEPVGGPTYFELTTAAALLHFVERQVDAAVLEVGLGGRLDATNVCLPVVSVITSISFDHTKQLGNSLAAIAREKAGIIKPGVPVVSGVLEPEAQSVIAEVAREHGCRLIQLGCDFGYSYHPPSTMDFAYRVLNEELEARNVRLAMRGPHQGFNAAVALATISELRHQGWCLSAEAVRSGMSRAALPGRVELIAGEPTIVLDTAHNAASARALVESLAELPPPPRRTLVLSISRDKDLHAILRELVPHFDRFVVTQYQENPRAVPAHRLADTLAALFPSRAPTLHLCPTPRSAWRYARQTAVPGELVCISGSFFLAAEMQRLVHRK
jgi:dihydrofolate synthase/folylpolyglutamate synthase